MNSTIWKFSIPVTDNFSINLPVGSKVLSVQDQSGNACIWVLLDPDAGTEPRHFRLAGTGHTIDPTGLRFVGTFQMRVGSLVFHLFEKEQSNVDSTE